MIFNAKFLLLTFVAAVTAQSSAPNGSGSAAPSASVTGSAGPVPSGLGITPCIINCVQPAATKVGCAFTDPSCVCVSDRFKADATDCLKKNCTAQEVTVAQGLQQSQCATVVPSGASGSGSVTGIPASSGAAPSGAASNTGSAASVTKTTPASTAAAGTSSQSAAPTNAALGSTVGSAWALAAGVLGAAIAL